MLNICVMKMLKKFEDQQLSEAFDGTKLFYKMSDLM
jgi:hypothetical protein